MTNFIEEFYYGKIDPHARSFEQNQKVQRDMQTITDSEEFLTDKLSGEEKKRFLQNIGISIFQKMLISIWKNDIPKRQKRNCNLRLML